MKLSKNYTQWQFSPDEEILTVGKGYTKKKAEQEANFYNAKFISKFYRNSKIVLI